MNYSISDPNSFSPLRFARFISEHQNSDVLNGEVVIGGELIFESSEEFESGRFALRSEGCVIWFSLTNPPYDAHKIFTFGDKIEVRLSAQAKVKLSPEIHLNGKGELKLLVHGKRELKPLRFDYEKAKKWHMFIRKVRDHFHHKGFLETPTPSLVSNPGMEPELEPFGTEIVVGRFRKKLFLPTSPELHLKQILSSGFTEIFEIKSCFRNGEISQHHQPEFHMLEWYRAYTNLNSIEKDLIELVKDVSGRSDLQVERVSIADLFKMYFRFKLTPKTTREELWQLAKDQAVETSHDDSWNDIFHRLFVAKIELHLGESHPVVIFNFPPSQAALARLTADGWADRFEFFWNGLEIANAFHELNDPKEQLMRFQNDQKKRIEKSRTPLEIDQNFMRALESGMPPSAGIALGLDRLFMAIYGIHDIRDARFFALARTD